MTLEEQLIPKYNVDEYQLWKGDWELWEGSPVAMSPSSFAKHGSITAQIVTALNTAVDAAQCNASVIVAVDWIVSNDTVVRPDVTVVCGTVPEKAHHGISIDRYRGPFPQHSQQRSWF